METLIPILIALPNIISAMVAVAALGTAAWQAFKRRDMAAGLELSERTIEGLVATVALLPQTEETARLKNTVRLMSTQLGVERTKLAPVVKQVEKLLADAGITTTGDDSGSWLRASEAVKAYREGRK